VNRLGRLWAVINLKACGIKVSLEGIENVSEPPYIFMCNHQSALDIFALLSALRLPFKWIAKKELFSMPFIGWALKIGKNIPIDRQNPRKALMSMNEAALRIAEGANVVIFPKGHGARTATCCPLRQGGSLLPSAPECP